MPSDPTVDEMKQAVCVSLKRPEVPNRWSSHEVCIFKRNFNKLIVNYSLADFDTNDSHLPLAVFFNPGYISLVTNALHFYFVGTAYNSSFDERMLV